MMNISQASELLFDWFKNRESFCISDDFHLLVDDSNSNELIFKKESAASVICALEDFENLEIVKSTEISGEKIWVLKKNFDSYTQTVELPPATCCAMASIINTFNKATDSQSQECDPKNISNTDVETLIIIMSALVEPKEENKDNLN